MRILSTVLITAGIVVLADVAITLAWKEPISSIYGQIQQDKLAGELETLQRDFPDEATLQAVKQAKGVHAKIGVLADHFAREVSVGDAIGRIKIPAVSADYVLIQGTDTASLQRGPGHYPDTPFPGQGGTVGIAGHRTTYLAPFRHIDQLDEGDQILLEMPYATFTYTVQTHQIVDPGDVGIVKQVGYERLVLTACHPLYSAAQRYAVFAKLTEERLFQAKARVWRDP
jgi:sortase A